MGNEVNRPLLKQLADDSGGLAAFVSREDNFQRQAQAFRRKLVRPAATNVKIRFDGASVYDVEPQEVPNLFYGAPIRLYGRYKQSGPVTITIEGEVLGAPMQQSVELSLPNNDQTNPEIERMWAWHRVQRLMAKDRRKGSLGNAKDEIVALCEGYSIASEYASFIVLENDGEYRRWKIKQRNATRIQRDRAARQALRQRLDQMRETAMSEVGPQSQKPQASRISPDPRQLARSADSPQRTRARPTRGADINVSRRSRGGGAIDPLTGMIALGLGITAAAAARRNRRRKDNV